MGMGNKELPDDYILYKNQEITVLAEVHIEWKRQQAEKSFIFKNQRKFLLKTQAEYFTLF